MQDVRKENHTATSKKHDKRCLGKPEEDTSMLQIKVQQEQLDTVIEENRKNLHTIKELKGKISAMEIEYQSKKQKKSQESQTEWEFQEYPCNHCVYMASCDEELNWHYENDHSDSDSEPGYENFQSILSCTVCGKRNKSKGELMRHRKVKHPHTIRTCRFFLEGICDFPDNVCWFNHTDDKTNNLVPQTLKQFS